jgi:hypothetical protein
MKMMIRWYLRSVAFTQTNRRAKILMAIDPIKMWMDYPANFGKNGL